MMTSYCPRCEGFAERMHLATPREYLDIVRQLIEIIGQGSCAMVQASCPLEDMFKTPMPGDVVRHDFLTACGRSFHLSADTYHGGAHWLPGDRPGPEHNPGV
jgi:hypothetical protein